MEKTGTHYVNNNEEQNATFRQISINCYLNAIGGMFNVLCAPSIAPDFSWGLYQISRMYGIRENICQAHCKDIWFCRHILNKITLYIVVAKVSSRITKFVNFVLSFSLFVGKDMFHLCNFLTLTKVWTSRVLAGTFWLQHLDHRHKMNFWRAEIITYLFKNLQLQPKRLSFLNQGSKTPKNISWPFKVGIECMHAC